MVPRLPSTPRQPAQSAMFFPTRSLSACWSSSFARRTACLPGTLGDRTHPLDSLRKRTLMLECAVVMDACVWDAVDTHVIGSATGLKCRIPISPLGTTAHLSQA